MDEAYMAGLIWLCHRNNYSSTVLQRQSLEMNEGGKMGAYTMIHKMCH